MHTSPHETLSEKELFVEQRRVEKWLNMLSKWDEFSQLHPRTVKRRVRKGIPDR